MTRIVSDPKNREIIGVVIPAYKVISKIQSVCNSIGPEVDHIFVVDDKCPELSGAKLVANNVDPRLQVVFNEKNLGVGGAVIEGYKKALEIGCTIVIKLDGDGQMDPTNIPKLIEPILDNKAGYTKGNRFYEIKSVKEMPKLRIFGNLILTFFTKFSTGYWKLFDPNNGFTAIRSSVLEILPLGKIEKRFFFESDMLFWLGIAKISVQDVAMKAIYEDEKSNLKVRKVALEFIIKHIRNSFRRIFYQYYLRDFSIASIELPIGLILFPFGLILAVTSWVESSQTQTPTPTGTLLISAISIIMGLQFLLNFISIDIENEPK